VRRRRHLEAFTAELVVNIGEELNVKRNGEVTRGSRRNDCEMRKRERV